MRLMEKIMKKKCKICGETNSEIKEIGMIGNIFSRFFGINKIFICQSCISAAFKSCKKGK